MENYSKTEKNLHLAIQELIPLSSYKLFGIDMSYRATGVAILESKDGVSSIHHMECLRNPEFGYGFHSLDEAMRRMKYVTLPTIRAIRKRYDPDLIIVEMPCFTQNARSALAIGMCWGFVSQLNAVLVEPSALKKWSGSRRGDKKTQVLLKVAERITPCQDMNNNNIVDALGLVFMTNDLIKQKQYEVTTR